MQHDLTAEPAGAILAGAKARAQLREIHAAKLTQHVQLLESRADPADVAAAMGWHDEAEAEGAAEVCSDAGSELMAGVAAPTDPGRVPSMCGGTSDKAALIKAQLVKLLWDVHVSSRCK